MAARMRPGSRVVVRGARPILELGACKPFLWCALRLGRAPRRRAQRPRLGKPKAPLLQLFAKGPHLLHRGAGHCSGSVERGYSYESLSALGEP